MVPSTDVQTDLQKVPIDRVSDIHKILIWLMFHLDWCSKRACNHLSTAPSHYQFMCNFMINRHLYSLQINGDKEND